METGAQNARLDFSDVLLGSMECCGGLGEALKAQTNADGGHAHFVALISLWFLFFLFKWQTKEKSYPTSFNRWTG